MAQAPTSATFCALALTAFPASPMDTTVEPVMQDGLLQWDALAGDKPEKTWAAIVMMYEAMKRTLGPKHRRVVWQCVSKAVPVKIEYKGEPRPQLILPGR